MHLPRDANATLNIDSHDNSISMPPVEDDGNKDTQRQATPADDDKNEIIIFFRPNASFK
jgi:hypothetical protein